MVKLSSWLPSATKKKKKKLHVKLKPLKLEGLAVGVEDETREGKFVVLEMKWKGPKSRLVPFYRSSWKRKRIDYSSPKLLREGMVVEWDEEEFESVCGFSVGSKDRFFDPWDVSIRVLYGEDGESITKLALLGKVSLDIADTASRTSCHQIETKLPVSLLIEGMSNEATLSISVSFAEVRNSDDPPGIVQNWMDSDNKKVIFKTSGVHKNDTRRSQSSCDESGELLSFNSDGLTRKEPKRRGDQCTESSSDESLQRSRTGSNPAISKSKSGLFSRKRNRLSLKLSRIIEGESLIEKNHNDEVNINVVDSDKCSSVKKNEKCWQVKEVASRDGRAKLKASVFFASFDQRSEKAAGESACAVLVTVIADWLHSNRDFMPTMSQFDSLITQGSQEWRNLCDNEVYTNSFPDNHFDLETVLKAGFTPLAIFHDKSFTGTFSPEMFESLKGVMSFDDIWREISRDNDENYEQRIYIVCWNDHFFVLKVNADAYYIIDSLGERLFEGCDQAYILRFDESSLMYGNVRKDEEMAAAERDKEIEEKEEVICRGKECCKEYITRFLAAIPLEELEKEEQKGTVSAFSLLQKLQIDFHYCSSSSASSSSTSSSSSPISNNSCIFSDDGASG